jgi:hypothetical protein
MDLILFSTANARREKSIVLSFPKFSKSRSMGALKFSIQLDRKAFKIVVVDIRRISRPVLSTDLIKIKAANTVNGMQIKKYAIMPFEKV